MTIDVTREMIEVLEAEIAVQVEDLKRMKETYETLRVRYPPPSYTERYYYIVRIPEASRELRSKRARLGWLRKRWIPELTAVALFQYATRGDSKNPYPYVWVIDYDRIESDYDRLVEVLHEKNYWERYWRPRKLRILRVTDGYRYAFEEKKGRPVIYVLAGDVYVTQKEYAKKPHICEHQAAFTVSILKTLGLVTGYRRERRRMTETELEYIPVRAAP